MSKEILTSLSANNLGEEVILLGIAANCKAGACMQLEDGSIVYIFEKHEWEDKYINQLVEVEGRIISKKLIPDVQVDSNGAISAGAAGEQFVLTEIKKIKKS